jgi:uncharacterized membrane protein
VTAAAVYYFRLAESWRGVYVLGAALALCLNVFVGVVQAFQKIVPLRALAPTGNELLFVIAHLLVLTLFVVAGVVYFRRFKTVSLPPVRP